MGAGTGGLVSCNVLLSIGEKCFGINADLAKCRNEDFSFGNFLCLRCPIFRDISVVLPKFLMVVSQNQGHHRHFPVLLTGTAYTLMPERGFRPAEFPGVKFETVGLIRGAQRAVFAL